MPNDNDDAEDTQRYQKAKQIITKEFDVEILHKWREIRVLEDELDKGYQLQALLEKLLLNEHVYAGIMDRSSSFAISQPVSRINTPAPSSSASSLYDLESPGKHRQVSVQAVGRQESISFSEKTGTSNEPGPLYELCPDGSAVRLRCPICGADKFRSILGLVNHCRINCGILVSNPDDRIQQCGIPVSPDEIPPDFFFAKGVGQLKRDRDLAQIRAGVQAPIIDVNRRPMIREFSETDTTIQVSSTTSLRPSASSSQVLSSIASHQADVKDLQSRFYIRKRVIIGNFARSLDTGLEESEAAQKQIPTHEWRLYLRPFDPHDDISSYIKSVRFHLHASYKPNDIITVDEKPFELAMTGWGEFPAVLEVHFSDPKNKPVEFIHYIRLRPCHSRVSQLMSEQAYDIELDRKSASLKNEREPGEQIKSTKYSVDDALAMASRFFPLFGTIPKQAPSGASYNRAVSYAEFMKLSPFDQQALEKERAIALQRHLLASNPDLTVEYVIEWCRKNGLSPVIVQLGENNKADNDSSRVVEADELGITEDELKTLQYCRYCGLAHFPQDKFDILQKNCSMRPRKLHLSSRSTASQLVSQFDMSADPIPEAKRPRIFDTSEMDISEAEVDKWPEEEQWAHHTVVSLELPSYQARRDTCNIFSKMAKRFLADIIQKGLEKLPDTIERAVGRPALLTPVHLYQAITGLTPISATASSKEKPVEDPEPSKEPNKFDFLSNSFMAGT